MKRRNKYQFRVIIPDYATYYFPQKKLLIKSMQTTKREIAIKYCKILLDKYNYILQSIKMNVDINTIKSLVSDFLDTRLEQTEIELKNDPSNSTFYELIEDMIKGYQVALNIKDYKCIKKDMEKFNTSKFDAEDIENLARTLLEHQINHLKTIKQKIETMNISNSNITSNINNKNIYTLEETFNEFIKNTAITMKWTNDTIKLCESVKKVLILYFSSSKNIMKIKRNEMIEFRNMLLNLQLKFLQKKHLKNQTLEFILEDSKDKQKLSENTVNKYMLRVTQYMNYCYENDYIQKNIFTNLKIRQDKISIEKARVEYTINEIYRLINELEKHNYEIKIITLLGIYQGMRLGEICQLRKKDIKQIDSIWCIDINIENGKKVKTKNSIRTIPIQSEILEQFLEYINDKNTNLFTYTSKKFSGYFRKNIHPLIVENIDDKKSFYSLRHNFINKLIQNKVSAEVAATLAGHTQQYSMTMNTYSQQINVRILKESIDKIHY